MITTKRVRKMKPKFIEVQSDEFEETEIYVADDGKEFTDLREASKYDSELKLNKIEKTKFWFPMIGDNWYKAKDKDELEFLINHLSCNYGGRRYGADRLQVGEWFTVVCQDRDNAGPTDHFVPLHKLKEGYKKLLEKLEHSQ